MIAAGRENEKSTIALSFPGCLLRLRLLFRRKSWDYVTIYQANGQIVSIPGYTAMPPFETTHSLTQTVTSHRGSTALQKGGIGVKKRNSNDAAAGCLEGSSAEI
jgi:hypothetical protein